MFKILKIFFVIVLYLVVGNIFAADNTPAPTDIQKLRTGEQTLIVGHLDYPPFYEYSNGKLMGIDADVVREVAKRMNIKKVEFVEIKDLQKLMAALDQGKVTIIATGLLSTPERKQKYLLTIPYYRGGGVGFLYLSHKNNFKTVQDLQGHKVGTMKYGYVQRYWLNQHGISGNNVKIYVTPPEAVQALKNGEIDVFVINYTICRYQAALNKPKLTAYLYQPLDVAYFMRKQDNALQESFNKALLSMWKDHSLYNIKIKYLTPIGIQPKETYEEPKE